MSANEKCTLPLSNLSSVLSWSPNNVAAPDPVHQTVTVSVRKVNDLRPKVLLCHDMKGGYLADRFDFGCFSPSEDGFGFSFWNWLNIDIFVYFSHHFVTLPPRSWIEVAKANGVKILGTFITEFDTGRNIWTNELNSVDVIDKLVDKLTELAVYYGFDGWLLNIENKILDQADLVKHLVSKLSAKIHEHVQDGLVIWYDSVTYPEGELKWQNELNTKNEAFFDACDGIFLNYTWKPENLNNSLEMACRKNRQFDVYVGVDVFGRNCFGGGGFNTRLAIEKIVQANLSFAIFAFGWVFETLPACDFLTNQQTFWNLIYDLLPVNKAFKIPFSTVFSTSHGMELFWMGKKCCDKAAWYRLGLQSPCQTLPNESSAVRCLVSSEYGAFVGSSCLQVTVDSSDNLKLFPIRFPAEGDFHLCVSYKWLSRSETCASLNVTNKQNEHLCSIPLEKSDGDQWCLDSKIFHSPCEDGLISLAATGGNSRLLIGYIAVCEATTNKSSLSYDEVIEQIRRNIKLHNALIG